MFKRAFVRGIQAQLVKNDRAVYPNEKAATDVADYIADNVDFDPGNLTYDKVAELANHLIDASNALVERGYEAGPAVKTAALQSLEKLAHAHVVDLMTKAAEGSTIEGGDKGNKEPTSGEGKMDGAARPAGYAENSRGSTDVDTKPGAVGAESDNPNKATNSPAGSNSITEQRTAALLDAIKVAMGSTIMGGDKGNTTPSSAEAKMDAQARPDGYAVLPSRGADDAIKAMVGGAAVIGKEVSHPNQVANTPGGSNSIVAQTKAAAEDPYLTLFKKVASEVHAFLPAAAPAEQKVAHVRAMMGMDTTEKAAFIANLYKQANEMPPWLMGKKDDEKKDEKKDEKGESKAEEKKEEKAEEKKEASLLDVFKSIAK